MRLLINIYALIFCIAFAINISAWFWLPVLWYLFNIFRLYEINRLRKIRDKVNIRGDYGKLVVRGINRKIDMWNGIISKRN